MGRLDLHKYELIDRSFCLLVLWRMKLSVSLFLTVAVCQREKAGNEFSPFVDQGESCAVQYFCCVMTIFHYEQTPKYLNMLEGKEKGFLKYITLFSVQT